MTWLWITIELVVVYGILIAMAIYMNKKTNRQKQIYSIIENSDTDNISLQEIVSALQMEFVVIKKEILSMSSNSNKRKYPLLNGSHLDLGKQSLILAIGVRNRVNEKRKHKSEKSDNNVVVCKHCGATNKIYGLNEKLTASQVTK